MPLSDLDKKQCLCYDVHMINSIKNKYYTYQPGEFLPIFEGGVLANRKQFHMYKIKKAAIAADRAWMSFVERAHAS